MKIVLDTNILVSGTFWGGNSSRIIDLIDSGKIELVLSEEIIKEYNSVINREEILDKIKNKDLILNKSIQKIIKDSNIVNPTQQLDLIKEDPDDNKILECALYGNVDYIISNDGHLLKIKEFNEFKIITPEEFLEILDKPQ
jgi:uncharacterized protein